MKKVKTQPPVEALMKLGPLPSSLNSNSNKLEKLQKLLTEVERPISDDEARMLIRLFGPDDCFGLAWTLLHIIEPRRDGHLKIVSRKMEVNGLID